MAAWICKDDGVTYAVEAPACPVCGSTEHWEAGAVPPAEPPAVTDEDETGGQADRKKPVARSSTKGAK